MLLKKIKKYLVGSDSETYAISLVTDPAIEENFLYFKREEGEKLEIALESNSKHMVFGAVLVPNRPIYRIDDSGEEFYVEFTQESIEKMSQDFFKNFRQFNATVQHEEEVPEVCVVESWLKSDLTADKSVALGLNPNLPIGTWFCGFKVNNIDVWERIQSGELRGFSVESMISLEELDFSKVEEAKFEEQQQPAAEEPAVEPQNADTDALEQPQTPQEVQEPTEEKTEPSEPNVEAQEVVEPIVEEPKAVEEPKPSPLEELVKNLQSELNALKETNQSLVETIKDLKSQPSAKPIATNGGNGGNGDTYANWRAQMATYVGA